MHVVYVTPDFIDNMGPTTGLPKYLFKAASTLVEWGHKVTVITCSNRTVNYMFYGINVYRLRRPNVVKYGDQEKDTYIDCYRDGYILNQQLHELYKNEHIDIIQYASLFGIGSYHDLPVPAVMRLSSYACMWPVKGREIAQNTLALMERKAAERCNAIFGPSYVVAKQFQNDVKKRVDVIETPFVMEEVDEDRTIYDSKFKGKKYFLFFGKLIEYKGLTVIEKVVYDILSHISDLSIAIVGDGDIKLVDKILIQAQEYRDRVIYNSAIGFGQLKPIIENAQFVVLPSIMENFSNACVEAMALGQIVIGTDGVSFEQLIADGVSGLLCKPDDVDSLKKKIFEALSLSEEEKMLMRKNAKKRIEKLSPNYVIRDLLNYYEQVIDCYTVSESMKVFL